MRDEIFNACIDAKKSGKRKFWPGLAAQFGYKDGEAIRASFRAEAKKRGVFFNADKTPAQQKETTQYTETDDYINIVCSSKRLKTKEDVIREFEIDTEVWKLEKFIIRTDEAWRKDRKVDWHVTEGKVTSGDVEDSGKILIVPLTRIECRFIRKTLEHISLDEIETMFQKKEFSFPMKKRKEYSPSDEVLEIDVTDLHFGSDANHEPEKRFVLAIDDIVQRIGKRAFEKIYLAVLGDIFHYDTPSKTTTSGTIVTTNGLTAYQVFDLGLATLTEVIGKLSAIAPLEVVFVPGNHDKLSGYTLLKALEAYFSNDDSVTFDTEHMSRKYRIIPTKGVSLVGWMHGDMPKARSTNWLQVEARDVWGKTKYSEIHSGNFHSQQGKEDGGVVLRYLPGMTDIDEWHYEKGYVGAVRALVSFVWHRTKGMREMWFTNVV